MALLTPTVAKITGASITPLTPNSGGDTIAAGDHNAILYLNGSGGSLDVVVAVPGNTKYGQANPDVTIAVPASGQQLIGPFPPDLRDDADQLVHLTYPGGVTGLTAYAVTVG